MDEAQLRNLSPQQKQELMSTIQQQVALQNMQELLTVSCKKLKNLWSFLKFVPNMFLFLQKVTDKCFKKCVSSPGSSLGGSEQVSSNHVFSISEILDWLFEPKPCFHWKKFKNEIIKVSQESQENARFVEIDLWGQ